MNESIVILPAIERFRARIEQALGLHFADDRLDWLADVLQSQLDDTRQPDAMAYLDTLESPRAAEAFAALAPKLTVPETYFFRHIEQFNALREQVLPERLQIGPTQRTLRVLSAGCASGEEAYSVAMILASSAQRPCRDVRIDAVDLNPAMIAKAREARYSEWSLRETPPDMRERWFKADGRDLVLDARIKQAVCFEQGNLADAGHMRWQPDTYDVVFCRNVLMYFTPDQVKAVVARLTASLAPDGYLFLGHAESLRGLSQAYHLMHTHGTFYYQRKAATHPTGMSASDRPTEPPSTVALHDNWVERINQSTERIRALATAPGQAQEPAAPIQPESPALDLFKQERFQDALAALGTSPPDDPATSAEWRHLRAVLLVHTGQLEQAQAICRQCLADDELDANAHHVRALCQEAIGDLQSAMDSDQTAAYLDPSFAMPHLHLGLMARRQGDKASAKRALGMALRLLGREDTKRLELFGGGFGRQALTTMCQAELASGADA